MTISQSEDKALCLSPVSSPAWVLWGWGGEKGSMVSHHFWKRKLRLPKAESVTKAPVTPVVFQSAGPPSTKPQILTLKHQPWGTGAPFVANSMWCGRSRVL